MLFSFALVFKRKTRSCGDERERCTIFVKTTVDLARKKHSKEYTIPIGAQPNTLVLQPETRSKTGENILVVAARKIA